MKMYAGVQQGTARCVFGALTQDDGLQPDGFVFSDISIKPTLWLSKTSKSNAALPNFKGAVFEVRGTRAIVAGNGVANGESPTDHCAEQVQALEAHAQVQACPRVEEYSGGR